MRDKTILEMYLEDMKNITPVSDEDVEALLYAYLKGDVIAKNRLIEGHMMYTTLLTEPFLSKGQETVDLIAESHLALTMAVNDYKTGDLKLQIKETVIRRLEELLRDEKEIKNTADELALRLNDLMKVSRDLAKELGREGTVKEIADRLLIPEREVEELLKISLNAMKFQ